MNFDFLTTILIQGDPDGQYLNKGLFFSRFYTPDAEFYTPDA
jgi:hypothetical protein